MEINENPLEQVLSEYKFKKNTYYAVKAINLNGNIVSFYIKVKESLSEIHDFLETKNWILIPEKHEKSIYHVLKKLAYGIDFSHLQNIKPIMQ